MSSTSKDESLFIPLEIEDTIFLVQRILFGFSCLLHVPALFCLLRETPPHQAMIKRHLVACQIFVLLTDIHYSILFEPVPLAEVFTAYCRGVLCLVIGQAKAMGILGLLGSALCLSTITCIIARHQSMMPPSSPWKFRKITKQSIFNIVLLSIIIPTTAFTVYPFSVEESERLITQSQYEISWIRERGAYIRIPESLFMYIIIWTALVMIFIIIIAATLLFWHMFYVLSKELNAPIVFIAFPMDVFFIQIGTRSLPFMVGVIGPFFICLHPIVHNLVLLLIFPTYRRTIAEAICGRCLRRKVNNSVWANPSMTQTYA